MFYTTFKNCNKFECFWDGHDCDDTPPKSAYYIDKRASYHQRHGLLLMNEIPDFYDLNHPSLVVCSWLKYNSHSTDLGGFI